MTREEYLLNDKNDSTFQLIRHIALAFANYCGELDITTPTFKDFDNFLKQGVHYYDKHIENANKEV